MSLVREVSLTTASGQPRLTQNAVREASASTSPTVAYTGLQIDGIREVSGGSAVQLIDATFIPGFAEEFGLVIRSNGSEGTRIGIRPRDGELKVDRTASGSTDFHDAFASIDTAPLRPVGGAYSLRIFVDRCSVEIFAQDGQVTLTELIFPDPTSTSIALYAIGGTATATSLTLTALA